MDGDGELGLVGKLIFGLCLLVAICPLAWMMESEVQNRAEDHAARQSLEDEELKLRVELLREQTKSPTE